MAVIGSIIAATVIISSLFTLPHGKNILPILATNSSDELKLTMVSLSHNSLADQSKYLISPDPFGNIGNYTNQDAEETDEDSTAGIVEISGLADGRNFVDQIQASSQYPIDELPKIVEITHQNRNGIATFNNTGGREEEELQNTTSQIRNLAY